MNGLCVTVCGGFTAPLCVHCREKEKKMGKEGERCPPIFSLLPCPSVLPSSVFPVLFLSEVLHILILAYSWSMCSLKWFLSSVLLAFRVGVKRPFWTENISGCRTMSLTWRDTHTYRALCRSLPGLFSLPILGGSQDLAPQSPPNTPTDQQNMSEPHRGSVAAEADSLGGACWAFSLPEATFQYLLCAASRPYRWPLPSSLDPSVAEKSRVLE